MGRGFDYILIALLVGAIALLVTGHDDFLFNLFGNRKLEHNEDYYDPRKLHNGSLIFCIILLVNEILSMLLSDRLSYWPIVTIFITVLAFFGFVVYLKKYAAK